MKIHRSFRVLLTWYYDYGKTEGRFLLKSHGRIIKYTFQVMPSQLIETCKALIGSKSLCFL